MSRTSTRPETIEAGEVSNCKQYQGRSGNVDGECETRVQFLLWQEEEEEEEEEEEKEEELEEEAAV